MRRRQTKHAFSFAKLAQFAMLRKFSRQSVQLKRSNNIMPLATRSISLVRNSRRR
jgi:hypothetical protein